MKANVVRVFEEARSELTMNFDRAPQNPAREVRVK